jgi:G3E family GTPase
VNEALEQIAFADRLILNKTDLVTPAALTALSARLRAINGMASIQRAERGVSAFSRPGILLCASPAPSQKVDIDYVLGVGGFDLERVVDSGAFSLDEESPSHSHSHSHGADEACGECGEPTADGHSHSHEVHGHSHSGEASCGECGEPVAAGHSHSHGHSHAAPLHDDAVTSLSLTASGELDLDAVNDWLGDLLAQRWADLYRLKGVLAIEGYDERYVIQGVHSLFEGACDRPWRAGEARGSKLVFIGKNLEKMELEKAFKSCLVSNQ